MRDKSTFIHETLHQFQYQDTGQYITFRYILGPEFLENEARKKNLKKGWKNPGFRDVYDYGNISKIKNLNSINTYEGQGQFIEDFTDQYIDVRVSNLKGTATQK